MNTHIAIQQRYSALAEASCCLSCGGASDLAQPAVGEVVVDLGSGRGQDVLRMAEVVGPSGAAYGVDLSEGMLARARRTASKLGVAHAHFVRSPLEALDLPDALADLVVSNCTLNHASDKPAVWAEIARILKPGGRFVISDIYATAPVPAIYADDPQAVAECWAGAVTREVYLATVRAAGFEQIELLEESAPYDKGHIQVASLTLSGRKPSERGGSGNPPKNRRFET